jgi:hypothetical protein
MTVSRLGLGCLIALLLALPACGGSSVLDPPGPPLAVCTNPDFRQGCFSDGRCFYIVTGLASHVLDPNAPTLVAQIRVGESVELRVSTGGCSDQNPTVSWFAVGDAGTITPIGREGAPNATLRGIGVGEVRLSATIVLSIGGLFPTTAYCPPTGEPVCTEPKKISVVRVVAAQ